MDTVGILARETVEYALPRALEQGKSPEWAVGWAAGFVAAAAEGLLLDDAVNFDGCDEEEQWDAVCEAAIRRRVRKLIRGVMEADEFVDEQEEEQA